MSNTRTLRAMLDAHSLPILDAPVLTSVPDPAGPTPSFDRIEGMLLGIAIGDALGAPTEGMLPHQRRAHYGDIRDYLPNRHVRLGPGERARGYPTDDTQMSAWTLSQMLEDGALVPANVAQRFAKGRIIGIGSAVRETMGNLHRGASWDQAGAESAGDGALMRIAPAVIPHLHAPSPALWADAVLCAAITHRDSASISACAAFVGILWKLLHASSAPPRDWWHRAYITVASALETGPGYTPRYGRWREWRGPLWRFVADRLPDALERCLSVRQAQDEWGSGAYLLETVPTVLHILALHADNAEEALVRAATDTVDNDTVAAIVGACVGALHGGRAFPRRWVERLSGWIELNDDGAYFRLIDELRRLWHRGGGIARGR